MAEPPPLRVCIDARVTPGYCGGVEQVVIGLAHGLSQLEDGRETYHFLAFPHGPDWLGRHVSGPAAIHALPKIELPPPKPWRQWVKRAVPWAARARRRLARAQVGQASGIPRSDGEIERAGYDLMHFPHQDAFLTETPTIYHPHDLQHRHLPENFSAGERRWRDLSYREHCERARMVAAATEWTRRDFITTFGLEAGKVATVPLAAPIAAHRARGGRGAAGIAAELGLPGRFAFFPAQLWAHKNHLKLLEGLAIARDRLGIEIPLVCTGRTDSERFGEIARRMRELRLEGQARFVGHVGGEVVEGLYGIATLLAFPTKFEGGGLPLLEAFSSGLPVACSNLEVLHEQAGDAALYFDPDKPESIADALARLWRDDELAKRLAARGREIAARHSWERTARIFRAHYRRIMGRPLGDEDRELISGEAR